jgi:uncharacterized membrane protein
MKQISNKEKILILVTATIGAVAMYTLISTNFWMVFTGFNCGAGGAALACFMIRA